MHLDILEKKIIYVYLCIHDIYSVIMVKKIIVDILSSLEIWCLKLYNIITHNVGIIYTQIGNIIEHYLNCSIRRLKTTI